MILVRNSRRLGRPPAPAASTLPAWVSALSVGDWAQISGTALSSIEPNPLPAGGSGADAKVSAWTSFVIDPANSILYQAAGGGHGDYSGNEVEKLSLNVGAPAWEQVRAPTASGSVADANYYSDNRPSSRHHYYGLAWNATESRIMLVGGARWNSGAINNRLDAFDINSGDYVAGGLSSIPFSQEKRPVCRDPRNDNIYVFGDAVVYKWTRSTGAWSEVTPGGYTGGFFDNATAFDTTRNVIRLLVGSGTDYQYAPDTGTWSTLSNSGSSWTPVAGAALVYVPSLDVFLAKNGSSGGAVTQIAAGTNVLSAFTNTGGGTISANANGVYNKFLYVPALGVCVLVAAYGSSIWALKVH